MASVVLESFNLPTSYGWTWSSSSAGRNGCMSTLSHRIKRFSSVTPEDLRSVIGEAGGYTICFDITAVRFNPFVCVLTPAQFDSHAVTFTQGTRLWATFSDAGEVKDMDRPIFCKIQCQQAHDEPQAQDIGEASSHVQVSQSYKFWISN
jgi:hypothetical protein